MGCVGSSWIMHGPVVSAVGIFITATGTFIRVAPDLDRRIRRPFFKYTPLTSTLFSIRSQVKESDRGVKHTVRHRRALREFIDYVDANDINEPPDQIPVSIKAEAAYIQAESPEGQTSNYLKGRPSNRTLVEILTQSIEKRCRNYGLLIASLGAVMTIIGTFLPS